MPMFISESLNGINDVKFSLHEIPNRCVRERNYNTLNTFVAGVSTATNAWNVNLSTGNVNNNNKSNNNRCRAVRWGK
jgi:hypothetical protein